METKICTTCQESKLLSDFHTNPMGSQKKASKCKNCRNEANRLYDIKKKTANKDYMTRRRKSNPERALFWACKDRARRKNIPFNITLDDIVIPPCCPILGIPLDNAIGKGIGTPDNSASVDRIIPEKGYVKGNILVISSRANKIKSNATITELEKITEFYKKLLPSIN
jgi:hypothetical protein